MSNNIVQYNGYSARVEFDIDDGLFFGRLAGVNDVVGFHADSVSELVLPSTKPLTIMSKPAPGLASRLKSPARAS